MTLGEFGSTLNDELNRLANGGTYRDKVDMVDEALAAKQWANRENINPYSTDTVGVLNEIAGLGTNRQNWLDFNGVCNYIAGTTGLPAAAALRQVYPTTDLLTGVASYYVDATDASASGQTITNLGTAGSLLPTTLGSSTAADSNDPKFLDFTGTNYVYLPGVNSNYLSVADAAALDITGDIDIRAQVSLDDWTPAANQMLFSKFNTTGNQRSWRLIVTTGGLLRLGWSADGTTELTLDSSVATGLADGSIKWVRVTLDVDNGASGRDAKFYLSDDGTTWTQLGTTATSAGVTSIYSSTAQVEVGANGGGFSTLTGKIFRAQIFNGIDGTKVLDVDTSVIAAGSATSFTAVTGQTVTINRSTSGRKAVAVTQPTWLFGTDDYMEVNNRYMSSGTYLYLPGVSQNWATTPDAAVLDITGDVDIRIKVALDDWTPGAVNTLIAKATSSTTNRSYWFNVNIDGTLGLLTSPDGTSGSQITYTSTVATGIADGATKWVRATLDVDNGASGKTATFFTSDDGTTWTQLGAAVTSAGTTSIFSGISPLTVGGIGAAQPSRGKFFRAQVRNGIDGTVVFDANFETSITSLLQTSFTESSSNAATVTIGRSGTAYQSAGITAAGYLYPGATNTFTASATDFLNFGAADSFTVMVVSRDWNTGTTVSLLTKKNTYSGTTDPGYSLVNFESQIGGTSVYITDGTNRPNAFTPSGNVAGLLLSSTLVRNVSSDQLFAYSNAVSGGTGATSPSTDTTTGSLSTIVTVRIGSSGGGGSPLDGEIYAAAIFRSALTLPQIRQIFNYFANREVYL